MKDYYNILGVDRKSSKEEIKKAYHILAHQYHPDKNNGNEKRFKEINEAYRILSDEKSRMRYDSETKENETEFKKESPKSNIKDKYLEERQPINYFVLFIILIGIFFWVRLTHTSTDNVSNPNNQSDVSDLKTKGFTLDELKKLHGEPINQFADAWSSIQIGSEMLHQSDIDFSYSVINVGNTFNKDGSSEYSWGGINRKTEGNFWIVKLKINNTSHDTKSITLKNLKMVDQEEREYDTYPSALNCDSQQMYIYKEVPLTLKPDIPCTLTFLFEVSKNSDSSYFRFQYH